MSLVSKSFYNEITPYCEVRVDDDDEINKYYKLRCKHFQGVEVDDDDCPDCYNERKESILAEYSFEIDYLFAMVPDMFMFEAEVVWLAKRVKKMTILEREGFESVLRILSAKKIPVTLSMISLYLYSVGYSDQEVQLSAMKVLRDTISVLFYNKEPQWPFKLTRMRDTSPDFNKGEVLPVFSRDYVEVKEESTLLGRYLRKRYK